MSSFQPFVCIRRISMLSSMFLYVWFASMRWFAKEMCIRDRYNTLRFGSLRCLFYYRVIRQMTIITHTNNTNAVFYADWRPPNENSWKRPTDLEYVRTFQLSVLYTRNIVSLCITVSTLFLMLFVLKISVSNQFKLTWAVKPETLAASTIIYLTTVRFKVKF